MEYEYIPRGVCTRKIIADIAQDGTVEGISFIGGCPGNTIGIGRLVKGMKIDQVIETLEGVKCGGRNTSCPDQLALMLNEIKAGNGHNRKE
ncbi:MAG: TIGR03905 family TSCPD domain-containing protein [Peptococcaceae bacterium]|nr:TIGR03905 family TSCPD domain-containing protein [Peptococcaceae bacterium]